MIIAVAIMGFLMACNHTAKKEAVMKTVDDFFNQAEQDVAGISSGEEFMAYFAEFEERKYDFIQDLFADFTDKEGNIKGFSKEETEEIQNYIYDRASAYNQVEGAKCAEFLEPVIANYENVVNAMCATDDVETLKALLPDYEAAEEALLFYVDYDNVLPELQTRCSAAIDKISELEERYDLYNL